MDDIVTRLRFLDEGPFETAFADGSIYRISGATLPEGDTLAIIDDVTDSRRQAAELMEKERLAREKSEELENTLAYIDMGISVFDSNGCLQTWNRKYLECFNKNEAEVRRGVSLSDLIEAEKQRGDFVGDVDLHVSDLLLRLQRGEVVRSQFNLANGRILSSIHSPLPGGGWIGTHTILRHGGADEAGRPRTGRTIGLIGEEALLKLLDDVLLSCREGGDHGLLLVLDLTQKPATDPAVFAATLLKGVRGRDQVARLEDGRVVVVFPQVAKSLKGVRGLIERTRKLVSGVVSPDTDDMPNDLSVRAIRLCGGARDGKQVLQAVLASAPIGVNDPENTVLVSDLGGCAPKPDETD